MNSKNNQISDSKDKKIDNINSIILPTVPDIIPSSRVVRDESSIIRPISASNSNLRYWIAVAVVVGIAVLFFSR